MSNEPTAEAPRWYRTRAGRILLVALSLGGVYLLAEHGSHTLAYLPWLLLAACPLMHVFMHGSMGSHGNHRGEGPHQSGD